MKRHLDRMAQYGCLVCGKPANLHHIMHMDGKDCRRDDRYIAPLCKEHHQGKYGVHGIGSEKGFCDRYGIDLVEFAKSEWERTNALLDKENSQSGIA